LACNTAWLAFLSPYSLGIDRMKSKDIQLLIWGGSSSVGQYAIQIANVLGFQFATTCRNRKVVESLGAEHIFDYTSKSVVEEIKKTLPNIRYVLDCIGTEESSALASETVVEAGGKLCTIQPGKRNTGKVAERVNVTDVLVFTAFYEELNYGKVTVAPRQEDRDLSQEMYNCLPAWLESGKVKPNKPRIVDGGLDGVEEGFSLYRSGKISGEKVVYQIG
jgi:NADPH:quinone reductase-like Zn-dependent oxidoreductase